MYFPYLRGKQYELLALKELSSLLGEQQRVIPIIEPVRTPARSGLDRCLGALSEAGVDFVLVMNPSVGSLQSDVAAEELVAYVNEHPASAHWNLALLLDEQTDVETLFGDYSERAEPGRRLTLIHRGAAPDLAAVPALTAGLNREFDVVDDEWRRRYFLDLLRTSKGVTLQDGFPWERRNADYLLKDESMFSDDHLFFAEEGWYGFSDFLTIGDSYADGGFTPRAVAIHWTYELHLGGPIMIRHFTSVSNSDTANVGRKFLEAAGKLVAFLDARDIHTRASDVIRAHVDSDTYPGLGIIKKLSIQNHLELVSEILSRP